MYVGTAIAATLHVEALRSAVGAELGLAIRMPWVSGRERLLIGGSS